MPEQAFEGYSLYRLLGHTACTGFLDTPNPKPYQQANTKTPNPKPLTTNLNTKTLNPKPYIALKP